MTEHPALHLSAQNTYMKLYACNLKKINETLLGWFMVAYSSGAASKTWAYVSLVNQTYKLVVLLQVQAPRLDTPKARKRFPSVSSWWMCDQNKDFTIYWEPLVLGHVSLKEKEQMG